MYKDPGSSPLPSGIRDPSAMGKCRVHYGALGRLWGLSQVRL